MMNIACPIQQQTFHLVKLHCRAHMTVRRPIDTITCVKDISTSSLPEQSQRVVHEITAPYEWAAKEGDISVSTWQQTPSQKATPLEQLGYRQHHLLPSLGCESL
jgi:hypothetical protein